MSRLIGITGVLAVATCLVPAVPARGGGFECEVFSDRESFELLNLKLGWILAASEDFEPPVSNLGFDDFAALADPLAGGVPNVDPGTGLGFPGGLAGGGLAIQSNGVQANPPQPSPGRGLAALGPGFLDKSPVTPDSVTVGADFFDESTDLLLAAEPPVVAAGLDLAVAFGGTAQITVYSTDGEEEFELVRWSIPVPAGGEAFFGFSCYGFPLSRINVGGPGGELVDDIELWSEEPVDPCPWDCGDGDGIVGIVDFLELLTQWNAVGGSCDLGLGAPGAGIEEFLQVLANWGFCPGS